MSLFPRHLLAAALAAALMSPLPAFAQDAPDDPEVIATATVPETRLVERYTSLAGSPESASALVQALRAGEDFTVTQTTTVDNGDGTTTTTTTEVVVANPAGPMGWGEVNITLSLAQALVESGAFADLQSALTGVQTTVTNPDGTTTTTSEGGVLAMRADGMGWGQIAKDLGFRLGELVSASNRSERAAARVAGGKADRAARAERIARADRPDRADKPERPDRPERPERPQRPERPDRPDRGGR